MPVTKRIFLWTAPRSVSNAFQFSMQTLPYVKTFHEPFSAPYYSANPLPWQEDSLLEKGAERFYCYEDAKATILSECPGKETFFVKELVYQIRGKFDMLLEEDLKSFSHSFLIRNPVRAVYSLYKMVPNHFEEWYQRGDVGIVEVYDLYCYLQKHLGISPPIIDADDLLANPEGMMEAYCNAVGVKYRDGMTKWEPKSMLTQDYLDQRIFSNSWCDAAAQSSGFKKPEPMPVLPSELPEAVHRCIEECSVPYKKLFEMRLKI